MKPMSKGLSAVSQNQLESFPANLNKYHLNNINNNNKKKKQFQNLFIY